MEKIQHLYRWQPVSFLMRHFHLWHSQVSRQADRLDHISPKMMADLKKMVQEEVLAEDWQTSQGDQVITAFIDQICDQGELFTHMLQYNGGNVTPDVVVLLNKLLEIEFKIKRLKPIHFYLCDLFSGSTPLHHIIQFCKGDVIGACQVVLQRTVNQHKPDSHGYYPIHYTCGAVDKISTRTISHVDLTLLNMLVENGADVNVATVEPDQSWMTPMCLVLVSSNHADNQALAFLEKLLVYKADVAKRVKLERQPIHFTAGLDRGGKLRPITRKDIHAMQILVKHGAKVSARDHFNRTPLHYAAQNSGCVEDAVQYLVDNGANVNKADERGHTALHLTCNSEQWSVPRHTDTTISLVQTLLDKGANVNQTDVDGRTVLHFAVACGGRLSSTVDALLKNKADPNQQDNSGLAPMHTVCGLGGSEGADADGVVKTIRSLVNYEACMDIRDSLGKTPLHHIIEHASDTIKNIATLELLKLGANVNSQDEQSKSLLHYACSQSSSSVDSKETTKRLVGILLKYGANPSMVDAKGRTALHYAMTCGTPKVVEYLLLKGSNYKAFDDEGHQPADLADKESAEMRILAQHMETLTAEPSNLLASCICLYQESSCSPDTKALYKACRIVARRVELRWKMLLRELEPYDDPEATDNFITALDVRFGKNELVEAAYQALVGWKKSRGNKASVAVLIKTLHKMQLTSIAEAVVKELKLNNTQVYSSDPRM